MAQRSGHVYKKRMVIVFTKIGNTRVAKWSYRKQVMFWTCVHEVGGDVH